MKDLYLLINDKGEYVEVCYDAQSDLYVFLYEKDLYYAKTMEEIDEWAEHLLGSVKRGSFLDLPKTIR